MVTYKGISPSGKASDSDSDIVGSNPAIPAKKSSFARTGVFYFLPINFSLFLTKKSEDFLEGNK